MQTAHVLVLIQKTKKTMMRASQTGPRSGMTSIQRPKTASICLGGSVFFHTYVHLYTLSA